MKIRSILIILLMLASKFTGVSSFSEENSEITPPAFRFHTQIDCKEGQEEDSLPSKSGKKVLPSLSRSKAVMGK